MSARPSSDAGFTLVEALVSLFVFSLIATGCVTLLMQSVASQKRVTSAQAGFRELQTARALFASDLSQLAERSVRTPDDARAPGFVGSGEALAFVRASAEPEPDLRMLTSLTYVTYALEGERLVRRSRAQLDLSNDREEVDRVVFAQSQSARFEFYDGLRWRTDWSDEDPPRAVAVIARLPRYGEVRIEATTGLVP